MNVSTLGDMAGLISGSLSKRDFRRRRLLRTTLKRQKNRSRTEAFLHIPKTGGSGIDDMFSRLAEDAIKCPTKIGHRWSLREIFSQYPDFRLSFVLRDPVERMTSGFNSRLRMGRPRYNSLWNAGEAAFFSHFSSPRDFILALIGDDQLRRSAALFGLSSVQHLKLNYQFYFESIAQVRQYANRFSVIGGIENMQGFVEQLAGTLDIDGETYLARYEKKHVSPDSASVDFSDRELAAIREILQDEYEIYDYLRELVTC